MSKRITVSIADWVYEKIENMKPEDISRSEWVEELIIEGIIIKEEVNKNGIAS